MTSKVHSFREQVVEHSTQALPLGARASDELCVLVVDDEVAICQEVNDYLKRLGIRSVACDCVATALDVLKEGFEPDCLLVDIMLAGNDGFALIDEARQWFMGTHKVPPGVVAMTGGADEHFVQRLFRRKVDDFLLKPVSMPEVRDAVLRSCGLTRLRRRFVMECTPDDDERSQPLSADDVRRLLYGLIPEGNINEMLACLKEDRILPPLML
ncbi:response regulator [Ectothiorhodospira sp. BSL-9]|uniref:response regulator n=1 Tax=Ectothiorhodospira sp. BSL-9 TaxID=1442136 RepID=UPI0007B44371|nr:response regulator [Ectothiorhodospira sp. BSL-9]ANB03180.1 hypothetical protein ECTOBSL9_2769 [Ectothiorhodospira sp. BSL-9]